jgi:5-methylcytosine-specific restriction enzyme B
MDQLGVDVTKRPSRGSGPRFVHYFGPVLDALRSLGGEAKPSNVCDWILKDHDVPAEEVTTLNKSGQSRFENLVAWARFYLTKADLIDGKKRGLWVLTEGGRRVRPTHCEAMDIFKEIRLRFQTSEDDEEPAPEIVTSAQLFDDPTRQFWFAGATWGDGDQFDRFITEGIWQNGYEDKFSDLVQKMKVGDRIAIKSAFVQKYNLPFEVNGKPVSCMLIKTIGTIKERLDVGQTARVDWEVVDPPKDWFFYTYRTTLVQADRDDEHARRLILFTFADALQDYDFWLRQPYWARKYGMKISDANLDSVLADEAAELSAEEAEHPSYGVDSILEDGCFFSRALVENTLQRLIDKKNIILQGPPGTGKTWLARRLGYALIGSRDRNVTRAHMRVVQFHPSLSYEDFVRGWRPQSGGGLGLVDGIFLEAIQAATAERDRRFVLIIEEINRGNPAQVFGELLTLLEDSKRRPEEALELAYRRGEDEKIFIPPNLHVIGTMNIADRSLALVDLALRRRFAFVTVEPQFGNLWRKWCVEHCGFDADTLTLIEERLTALNKEISADRSLGSQYRIGHSYVTPLDGVPVVDAKAWFRQVVETEIAPLLEEYWFDAQEKAEQARSRLLVGLPE